MKFSLDELVRIRDIAGTMKGDGTMRLMRTLRGHACVLHRAAARNELTRRSLFKKGRGE